MPNDRRGLDHLMEQNEAELDFLSAYGGVDDASSTDAEAILAALERFLKAGGIGCEDDEGTLVFAFGTAKAEDEGCRIIVHGQHLPLVTSDMHASGFRSAVLAGDRSSVEVWLTAWGMEQRRFIERLVEHHAAA